MHHPRTPAVLAGLFAASAVLASCMPLLPGSDLALADQEVRITFLHTSDIHSRLIPYDFAPLKTDQDLGLIPEMGPFGGATRMAALIAREREKNPRTLHVDSGDCFQGAPIFNENSGEVEFRFLSRAHLDAAVVGNHEFDAGAKNFVQKAKDFAAFPLLAANYYWDDLPAQDSNDAASVTSPYTIKMIEGVRVGIIGMANISSLNSIVEGGNSLQATPLEQNEILRSYVELLKPMVDLVTVVSHLGLTEDQDLVHGYEAFYEYGRIKDMIACPVGDDGQPVSDGVCRTEHGWTLLEWAGEQGADTSVVKVLIPGVSGIDVIFGGHLHVVLNPPQTLTDPSGRKVLLVHSGAFAKYVGRFDAVIKMPPEEGHPEGAEVLTHDFRVFPLDSLWCDDAIRAYYRQPNIFWEEGQFQRDPKVLQARQACTAQEDRLTHELLLPYLNDMAFSLQLPTIFAYAPRDVARRNNSTGGDSPLGNLAADSMRVRRRVEAELAITNSLGIRDNLYAGALTHESMFNVFPFENTINIMYLSGHELQETFDFVAERSASRGCVSQAQISGARFTMDCLQVQLNDLRYACKLDENVPNGSDCPARANSDHAPWECIPDEAALPGEGRCWAHPAINLTVGNRPIDPNGTYKTAVNDYIAKGGSGFNVLKRNTTRVETGVPLRDSLIGYMQGFCSCDEINSVADPLNVPPEIAADPVIGVRCGAWNAETQKYELDSQTVGFCRQAQKFKDNLVRPVGSCTCGDVLVGNEAACGQPITQALRDSCTQDPTNGTALNGPWTGKCSCADALQATGANAPEDAVLSCGTVSTQLLTFCKNPTTTAIAVGIEDGRIGQRVK